MSDSRVRLESLAPGLVRARDTCNVYVLVSDDRAVLIDVGSGAVFDRFEELGISQVDAVLVTHHHRDQTEGLTRAHQHGAQIWVPPVEHDLIADADRAWAARRYDNSYDVLGEDLGPLSSHHVDGSVAEYRWQPYGPFQILTWPTPGHTVGSVSYFVDLGGQLLGFTGDLIAAPGKLWSLATTQWTYNGVEGVAASWHSLHEVLDRRPSTLFPAHGDPIDDPPAAVAALATNLARLMDARGTGVPDYRSWRAQPYRALTPHLLENRTAMSRSYTLVSRSGKALVIDFGYDFSAGLAPVGGRSSRRPLLATIDQLKAQHAVERVDVVLPTHYHDDHVAGFNLLRDVEGAAVWAASTFADVLSRPHRYDLPCLWYDPIPVDAALPLESAVVWEEYELTLYELPGHTLYAVAVLFEVDGVRVVATGDQQGTLPGVEPEFLNYTYRNRFDHRDFERSANLYRKLAPDLMISGHWEPRWVDQPYLDRLLAQGRELAAVHELLLPLETFDLGAEGVAAWIRPFRSHTTAGGQVTVEVEVRNPFHRPAIASVTPVVPTGWRASPSMARLALPSGGRATGEFTISTGRSAADGERVAMSVVIDDVPLGQVAVALVSTT